VSVARSSSTTHAGGTIPVSAGIGLRAQHHRSVVETRPGVGWFEVHSENYFGRGGEPLHSLERVRADYPVSLHGVGLSLGSRDALDQVHLGRLRALIERIEPGLVSEHLCWNSAEGVHLNDLVPVPYTETALDWFVDRVSVVQDFLGRPIWVENPSSYLEFIHSSMPEWVFLSEVARRSGCGILLDVNNVFVSCRNHGWDPVSYLAAITPASVGEIHLAGHALNEFPGGQILIDTHDRPVAEEVWRLYEHALRLLGPKPTLIEWDSDLPELSVLVAEAEKAQGFLESRYACVA
jgi:uncharacterized protein (UPF0276 family)